MKTILIFYLFISINIKAQNPVVVKESGDTIRFNITDLRAHKDRYEDGKVVRYYENGKVRLEAWQTSGQINGLYTLYYPNGLIEEEGMFLGGKRTGMWIFYTKSGNIRTKGCYINGLKEGIWEYYNEKGNVTYYNIYDEGDLIERNE